MEKEKWEEERRVGYSSSSWEGCQLSSARFLLGLTKLSLHSTQQPEHCGESVLTSAGGAPWDSRPAQGLWFLQVSLFKKSRIAESVSHVPEHHVTGFGCCPFAPREG